MALTQTSTNGIKDATIATADIADDAVTADKLANAINTDIAAKTVLTGSTNNTITTVTGANAIQGEANLTFDGSTLNVVDGGAIIGGGSDNDVLVRLDHEDNTGKAELQLNAWGSASISLISNFSGSTYQGVENGSFGLSSAHARDINFVTAGSERFRIRSGGDVQVMTNLGIGGSPTNNLHLGASGADQIRSMKIDGTNGSSELQGFIIENDGANSRVNLKLGTGGGTPATKLTLLPAGGMTFNGDTAAANALDDYEEGTWTPTSRDGTLSYARANYTKIGRMVHVSAYVHTFSDTSTNDSLTIQGLPFGHSVGDVAVGSVLYGDVSDANKTVIYLHNSRGGFIFHGGNSGGYDTVRYNELNGNSSFYFQATYFA